jgi:hypothetical protein
MKTYTIFKKKQKKNFKCVFEGQDEIFFGPENGRNG